ncbi:MAG: hypothetical protein ACR2LY_00205 [Thermoleophilaceae bacterium]
MTKALVSVGALGLERDAIELDQPVLPIIWTAPRRRASSVPRCPS